MSQGLKNFIFRLVLLLIALLFALAVLEVFMRVAAKASKVQIGDDWDRPGLAYYPARANPWIHGSKNPLRVAIIGDSFSNGQGVQADDTFGLRLERLLNLNAVGRPAAVDIWAKGGLSTYDEVAFLDKALAWKPDILVLQVFLNDTEDKKNYAQLREWREGMMPRPPSPWLMKILRHTRVGEWLYVKIENIHSTRGFAEYYRHLYSPDYSGWAKFKEALHEFKRACTEEHVKLMVVIFPIISHVNRYPFDYIHERIHRALDEEKIGYVDLIDEFRGKMPVRLEVVPKLDSHPNEIAHRIASEAIFNYMLANGLIDSSFKPKLTGGSRISYWMEMADRMQNPLRESEGGADEE